MKKILFFILLSYCSTSLLAQAPINDECDKAIELTKVNDFCSAKAAFTNVAATPSGYGPATCFASASNDVWFKFTPLASDINVIIDGRSDGGNPSSGGTLLNPEAAMYYGECGGTLQQVYCSSDATSQHIVNLYKGGLVIGATYYLRVQGQNGKVGTFRICANNFNPPKVPGGDCGVSPAILCDQTAFVAQSVNGAGNDTKEANDAGCFKNGTAGDVESNSTWFKWTCDKSGTLEFTLFPLKQNDDLDFVIYELPNGVKDCSSKTLIRCMASGDNTFPSKCMGPTGLKAGQTDVSEDAGCNTPGKDNYLKPLDMVTGKSYALVVNNFTTAKVGFNLQFGGTGTFLGPTAKFSTNIASKKLCVGQKATFSDESNFSATNGNIVKWTWAFGENTLPATANTKGPHEVKFNSAGKKYIALTIETDKGCVITTIDTFLIEACCDGLNAIKTIPAQANNACFGLTNGVANPNAISVLPLTYKWDVADQIGSTLKNLGNGPYSVTITNTAKCVKVLDFKITSPPQVVIDTMIKKPTCNGGADGSITVNVTGGVPPYLYELTDNTGVINSNYQTSNVFNNLKQNFYFISVKDANSCTYVVFLRLKELELILDPNIKAIYQPKCKGGSDGAIDMVIGNGLAPFQYDFGQGFQNEKILSNIKAGTYVVKVLDKNLCKGDFNLIVGEPTALSLKSDTTNITCFGANDGKAAVTVTGATPPYSYKWTDGQADSNIEKQKPGTYTVTVTDANNCTKSVSIFIKEPAKLTVDVIKQLDNVCFGDKKGEVQIFGKGGVAPYQYSLDGLFFQKDTAFKKLGAGQYSISIKDTSNCENTVDLTINEPDPLRVDAGGNKTIELGYTAQLKADVSPLGRPVTYLWSPVDSTISCKDCAFPIVNPYNTTIYTVKITDQTNCMAVDRVVVEVYKKRPIYIPTVFSPINQDGVNDRFMVFGGIAARKIQVFRVFDRWGEMVFEATNTPLNDTQYGWDGTFRGKSMQAAVFTYYVQVEFIDNEVVTYKGDVMLIE